MGLFGKSFEEKVEEAITSIRAKGLAVRGLSADVAGKVVTLKGEVDSVDVKGRIMQEFNALIETDNTMNQIAVAKRPEPIKVEAPAVGYMGGPEAPETVTPSLGPVAAPAAIEPKIHLVVSGETLSKIAKHYYGSANKYMKIFEANKDQLSNPDVIKVGQKLRIPE